MQHLPESDGPEFSSLFRKPYILRPPKYIFHSGHLEEEIFPDFKKDKFYPAKPGVILDGRFQLLVKVGFDRVSTSWLARDLDAEYVTLRPAYYELILILMPLSNPPESQSIVTLRIMNCNFPCPEEVQLPDSLATKIIPDGLSTLTEPQQASIIFRTKKSTGGLADKDSHTVTIYARCSRPGRECRTEEYICEVANVSSGHHPGKSLLRTHQGVFRVTGHHGIHMCFIYEPMRESLLEFCQRFENNALTVPIFIPFIQALLECTDFLHTVCKVVHTGKSRDLCIKISQPEF